MKRVFVLILNILLLMFAGCGKAIEYNASDGPDIKPDNPSVITNVRDSESGDEYGMINIIVTVGNNTFPAKLYDNAAARALLAQLPMSIDMSELNGNEKYYTLNDALPTNSQRTGNICAGDLMLYGSDCLVLFYESFSTSYNYTKLGYIEDASGLAAALGKGNAEVSFSVSK